MDSLLLQHYFETLIQCVATAYMTICLMLAFFRSPKDSIYRPYRQAKRMLTMAFASMSANLIIWCLLTTGNWAKFNYAIACIDIILFYFEELMLCYSFCHILNNSFLTRRRIAKDAIQMGISSLFAILPLFPQLAAYRQPCVLVALAVMIENIAELAFLFRKQYRRNGEMLDNYFSTDMHRFVRWTSTSITLLIISWVWALATMFADVYVNWMFQIYMVSLNVFIATNFINFAPQYGSIAMSYGSGADATMPADAHVGGNTQEGATAENETNMLHKKIAEWVEARRYVGSQFTIDELASALGTNKNYLSYFINERFGMNFSAWVSSLRVAEAKRLMSADTERKLEDIAYQVGFSSPSYFSKVFSFHEGMSPTVWKKKQREGAAPE